MPKYYCDYCDKFLIRGSEPERIAHNEGWRHKAVVKEYYEELMGELPHLRALAHHTHTVDVFNVPPPNLARGPPHPYFIAPPDWSHPPPPPPTIPPPPDARAAADAAAAAAAHNAALHAQRMAGGAPIHPAVLAQIQADAQARMLADHARAHAQTQAIVVAQAQAKALAHANGPSRKRPLDDDPVADDVADDEAGGGGHGGGGGGGGDAKRHKPLA